MKTINHGNLDDFIDECPVSKSVKTERADIFISYFVGITRNIYLQTFDDLGTN